MIDSSRLERSLITVARRYAPALVAGWQQPGDYPAPLGELAQALATYNVLVMVGDPGAGTVKAWTDAYLGFYALLTEALFPSFQRVSAFYVDQSPPLIVAVYGEATPVITTLAGFVVPYVVARQGTRPADVELNGMMDMILEELEATDVSRDDYRRLREGGTSVLRGLLEGDVKQFPLTPPIRPIFDDLARRPAAVSTSRTKRAAAPPPPPADLPEPPLPSTIPEERQMPPDLPEVPAQTQPVPRTFDPDAVPIFFNPGQQPGASGATRPAPPVPPLPPR
jgi:hypothetical protein